MTAVSHAEQIARCEREIREIQERPDVVAGECPAWLVHLGVSDWEAERDLLEQNTSAIAVFSRKTLDGESDLGENRTNSESCAGPSNAPTLSRPLTHNDRRSCRAS